MWFVYVILCGDGSFYTGYTDNIKRRFALHQSGKGGRYTRAKKVVKVIHLEKFNSKSGALKREAEIKGWSRAEKIKRLNLVYS